MVPGVCLGQLKTKSHGVEPMSYVIRKPLAGVTNSVLSSTPGPTGINDSGDPNHPLCLRNRDESVDTYESTGRILLAKKGGIARPAKPKIKELYLYDSSSKAVDERIIAKEIFKITNKKAFKPINSWKTLGKVINRYSVIGKLVLSFHGYGGGMIVGGHVRDVDQLQVKKLFSGKNTAPMVTEIHFFSCNIGNRPVRLAAFGRLFGAKTVSGYTWYIVHQRVTLKLGSGDTASVKRQLKPYRGFIVPSINDGSLKPNRVIRFMIIYGSSDGGSARFPLSFGDERKFKPLNQARERKVMLTKVGSVQQELESSPISPFERIVVTLR